MWNYRGNETAGKNYNTSPVSSSKNYQTQYAKLIYNILFFLRLTIGTRHLSSHLSIVPAQTVQ